MDIRSFLSEIQFDPSVTPDEDPSWPRITIITPSFNQAEFLERTIISIHNQRYPNLEHIIIDGGSTDGSTDIIRRYEKVLKHWQSEPDGGQCDAISSGADMATGDYMTWVNSDDILMPGALLTLASYLKQHPDIDIVYGNQVELNEIDQVTKRLYTIDFDIRDFLFEANIIIHQQSSIWRTELYRSVGGINDCPYAMDYEMFYRMYLHGFKYARLNAYISGFRVYERSLTGSGQVILNRDATIDGAFRDYMGRERGFLDRVLKRPYWKARRFASEPRAFWGALENRLYKLYLAIRKN